MKQLDTLTPLDYIEIPNFQDFIMKPKNPTCLIIESTILIVEVLWWIESASWEFSDSGFSHKMLIEGDFALVIRYRREKDNTYRPTCVISFDTKDDGIYIRQIQGSNDKNVAFRFHSSFNTTAFFLKVIEDSFLKKWIPVKVESFPTWIENASYASQARERYNLFALVVRDMCYKYF